MKISTGIDIVEIIRIRNLIEKSSGRFTQKVYTNSEVKYCTSKSNSYKHFAGKFAAKEAIFKAMNLSWETGILWKDIEIGNNQGKEPFVVESTKLKQLMRAINAVNISVSISLCNNYAVSVAIIIYGD
jgi:holo-[acyl-carrier protein] synthase